MFSTNVSDTSLLQVQWHFPKPQHGSEAAGAGTAGLQTAAVQSGEV